MILDHEMKSVIDGAFAKAEADVEPGDFVFEAASRRSKRHRIRVAVMMMAVAAGSGLMALFFNDALAVAARRWTHDLDELADLVALLLPLIVAGVIIDALTADSRPSRRGSSVVN